MMIRPVYNSLFYFAEFTQDEHDESLNNCRIFLQIFLEYFLKICLEYISIGFGISLLTCLEYISIGLGIFLEIFFGNFSSCWWDISQNIFGVRDPLQYLSHLGGQVWRPLNIFGVFL